MIYLILQSKDFHERGKRHKENVEKKITELRKKGVKDAQAKQDMADFLQEMEDVSTPGRTIAVNPVLYIYIIW